MHTEASRRVLRVLLPASHPSEAVCVPDAARDVGRGVAASGPRGDLAGLAPVRGELLASYPRSEPPGVADRYGDNTLGRSARLALWLVESGARS